MSFVDILCTRPLMPWRMIHGVMELCFIPRPDPIISFKVTARRPLFSSPSLRQIYARLGRNGRPIPTSWRKGFAADHCLLSWRGLNVNLQARRVLTDPIAFLSRNGGFCPVSLHYAFPSIFRALCLLPLSSFLSFCP